MIATRALAVKNYSRYNLTRLLIEKIVLHQSKSLLEHLELPFFHGISAPKIATCAPML
jgi:hypothetical protein